MRRPLAALFLALLGAFAPMAPALAADGSSVSLVIAHDDGTVSTRRVPAATAQQVALAIQAEPGVRFASLDVPVRASRIPNDPLYASDQWAPKKLRAPEAWDRTTGSSDVVVAVVDTGVDASHPDLAGAVLPGIDYVDNDNDPSDVYGHGTTVAGVIAGRGDNSIGVAGYCWQCKILPVRVLGANGSGASSDVALGIWWAADHGADVINLSLGGGSFDPGLSVAVAYAEAKGIVVVASSGNEGIGTPQYPAALTGVVAVGASDLNDNRASFSNFGSWVDLVAPGVRIATTSMGGGYVQGLRSVQGTSYSSPAVAGIVALGLSAFPGASATDLAAFLVSSAVTTSAGPRVDAAAYLDALAGRYGTVVPQQVSGADRVATAVALSGRVRARATTVVVARADSPADALAAAPLAGKLGAPVLLTASGSLSAAAADEVRRLGATSAWLAGGLGALGPGVEAGLRAAGVTDVHRLDGRSRYDTARLIATEVGGTSVYLTNGEGWADAVALSGLAAFTQRPILLTRPGSVPAETVDGLVALHATDVTVLGGTAVVAEPVLEQVRAAGATARRLSGPSRYATSELVAAEAVAAGATVAHTWLATGADWPDALAAGPAAAASGGVLLLMDGRNLGGSPSVTSWLIDRRAAVRDVVVVGGDAAVTPSTFASLSAALRP